jgi:hypothetical protein
LHLAHPQLGASQFLLQGKVIPLRPLPVAEHYPLLMCPVDCIRLLAKLECSDRGFLAYLVPKVFDFFSNFYLAGLTISLIAPEFWGRKFPRTPLI